MPGWYTPRRSRQQQRDSPRSSQDNGGLAKTNKMNIIAVHGDAIDKIGFELCERANRCADIRLEKLKGTYENMAAKAQVRYEREQREIEDLLYKLKRDKAQRRNEILNRQSLNKKRKSLSKSLPTLTDSLRPPDKLGRNLVSGSIESFLPSIDGQSIKTKEIDESDEDDGEEKGSKISLPKVVINNAGSKYEQLQNHIYYNHRQIDDKPLSTTRSMDSKTHPQPIKPNVISDYVIDNDIVKSGANMCSENDIKHREYSWEDYDRSRDDHPLQSPCMSEESIHTPRETSGLSDRNATEGKHGGHSDDSVSEYTFKLPKVVIRRFPDDNDQDDFGVSMRMALQSSNIATPLDRPSPDKGRHVSSSSNASSDSLPHIYDAKLFPGKEKQHLYGLTTKSLRGPNKKSHDNTKKSFPALTESQSVIKSIVDRPSTLTREPASMDDVVIKGTKRKPMKMSKLPITLRYRNTTCPQPSPRENNILMAVYKHKKALDERISKFLSSDINIGLNTPRK